MRERERKKEGRIFLIYQVEYRHPYTYLFVLCFIYLFVAALGLHCCARAFL